MRHNNETVVTSCVILLAVSLAMVMSLHFHASFIVIFAFTFTFTFDFSAKFDTPTQASIPQIYADPSSSPDPLRFHHNPSRSVMLPIRSQLHVTNQTEDDAPAAMYRPAAVGRHTTQGGPYLGIHSD